MPPEYLPNPGRAVQPTIPPALALAEDLDLRTIYQLNHPMRGTRLPSKTDREYQDAWVALESAMASSDPQAKEQLSHDAHDSFQRIHRASRLEKYRQNAGRVLDFLPSFQLRIFHEPYPSEIIRQQSLLLGKRAVRSTYEASLGDFYENIIFGLGAHNGNPNYLILPGSVREEASQQFYDHDGYVIRGRKIPVQLKATERSDHRKYDPRIHKINVRPMLTSTAVAIYGPKRWAAEVRGRRVLLPPENMRLLCRLTGELLVARAKNKTLSGCDEEYFCSLMSEVRRRIDLFDDQQLASDVDDSETGAIPE